MKTTMALSTTAQKRLARSRKIKRGHPWAWAGITALLSVISLIPILEMVVVSLEPMSSVESGSWLPQGWDWSNYGQAFHTVRLFAYTIHSLIVSVSSVIITVIVAVGVAYILARFHFRYRSVLAAAILVTQMIPAVALLLPIYILYANVQTLTGLHLIGSFPALIMAEVSIATPLAVWLLISGLAAIPREMDEAAFVDGATHLGVLWRVLLPIALPTLAAVGIFSFLSAWNDILFASVLTDHATRTLAIGLQEYVSPGGSGSSGLVLWNQLMAGALMSAAPAVAFFLGAQRFLVRGLSSGAVSK